MSGGKKGGAEIEVDLYFMSIHLGICMGADVLKRLVIKEKDAWKGVADSLSSFRLRDTKLFGGDKKEGGIAGVCYYLPGAADQVLPDELAVRLHRANGADCPGFRGLASLFFTGTVNSTIIGTVQGGAIHFNIWNLLFGGADSYSKKGFYWSANNPYLPGIWAEVRRAPVGLDPSIALIARIGSDFFPFENETNVGGPSIDSMQLSPDGKTMLLLEGGTGWIWDIPSHSLIATFTVPNVGSNVALLNDGRYYAVQGFAGQAVVLVSPNGTVQEIVPDAGIPQILDETFNANGLICFNTAVADGAYYLVGAVVATWACGFRAGFYFGDNSGGAWGIGETSGGDIGFVDMSDGTTHIVVPPNPIADGPYAVDNGQGEFFVFTGDTIMLIDKTTFAVTDSAAVTMASNPRPVFRNLEVGASFVWLHDFEYSTLDLSLIRAVNLNDWTAAGSGFDDIYSWHDHALLSIDSTGLTWRYLDRGESDANPAHIIYECLTDTNWGMGSPSTLIDVTSFDDAAVTLATEQLGLSLIWTRQASIQDFIQEILDHIQAVLFVDPTSGLLTLKLIRGDYDPDLLPILTPSNADLTNFGRKLWGEIINEIVVTWTNPENEQDETVAVHDLASIATQGGVVSDGRNYYGVRSAALADRLARRDLRASGQPLASCEVEVDRTQYALRPASCVKLNWPEYGLAGTIMRVTGVDYGRPGDPAVKLSLLEDVFGLDVGTYVEPPPTFWEDPSVPPTAAEAEVITLPYFAVAQAGLANSADYPDVQAGVLATNDNEDAWDAELWSEVAQPDGSIQWEQLATITLIGRGELSADLPAEAQSVDVAFASIIGQTVPQTNGFAVLGTGGDEAMEFALVSITAGGTYTLSRGVLDTVPRAWPATTVAWFVSVDDSIGDPTVRSVAEVVNYKLLTRTSQGTLSLFAAPMVAGTLGQRPWLPLRPANVTIDSVQFNTHETPVDMIGETVVPVTWSNRNRVTEDSQVLAWTDGDVTPEVDQTTTIYVYAEDGTTLLDTIPLLTGTSYSVPAASFAGEPIGLIRVGSSRTDADGTFDSLQNHGIWVQLSPLAAGALSAAGSGSLSLVGAGAFGSALSASGVGAAAFVGEGASVPAVNQFETLGNAFSANPGAGAASSNAQLIRVIPTQNGVINTIYVGVLGSTGQSAKALIYSESGGEADTQTAVGTATALGTISTPTIVALPLGADVPVTAGVPVWVGYVPSASISYSDVGLTGVGITGSDASVTYAAPQADLTGLSTPGSGKPVIFAPCSFSAALSGGDIIASSEHLFHANTSQPTWINIPKGAVGDVAYLLVAPTNGGPPTVTTPSGWTLVSSPALNGSNFNGKTNVFRRVLDGTESGAVAFTCASYSVMEAKMAIVRGIDVSGTIEQGLVTSSGSGTNVTSPAITSLVADCLLLNFFAAGAAGGTDLTGAADAWTDYFDHSTTLGTDAAISLTYRDAPTATSYSTETRTNAAAGSTYAVVGFALPRL